MWLEKKEGAMLKERKHWQRERASRGCIHFLWSYIIYFKSSFFFYSHTAFNWSIATPCFSHHHPPLFSFAPLLFTSDTTGDRPYLSLPSSAVMLIYGSIMQQLVQTEAHSSLIKEQRLWSWELGQHMDVYECEHVKWCVCVCMRLTFLHVPCSSESPKMETNWDKRKKKSSLSLNSSWLDNDNFLFPQWCL